MTPRITAHADRVSRLSALVLLEGWRRGWTLGAASAPFEVQEEVPHHACPNGLTVDVGTGLGYGWDGTTVGFFIDSQHLPAGLICCWDRHWHWNPAPGERGFHYWTPYPNGDRLGVMLAPKSEVRLFKVLADER